MDIVLGATGRVGSALVRALLANGRTVRAVVRNADKAARLQRVGADVAVADFADAGALRSAFSGGDSVFILTAEDPASHDGIAEGTAFLEMCREAMQAAGTKRIIGLSSSGAQHATGTGFLTLSYRMEHAFDGMAVEKTFVRPSYYYSNWMISLPLARESGVLPTFFPVDFAIPMIAPEDVARFAAAVFAGEVKAEMVHDITGPHSYTASDIARMLGEVIGREVRALPVPEPEWVETLTHVGFSPANARSMAEMTAATLSGLTAVERKPIVLPTAFPDYARQYLAGEDGIPTRDPDSR